ncbi:unnamed protein product, partial [Brassica rapa]
MTRTVHRKGQRAESKDQRADMCTDGQPRTSYSPHGPKSPKQSTRRARVLSPRTNVLICVLIDSHGRPVCADGHTQTHMDSHGRPVCVDGTHTDVLCVLTDTHGRPVQPTWAKITQTVHGKGQRAESRDQRADMFHEKGQRAKSKDQRADMYTDGQPRTSCVCWRTPTDVLCVLNRQPTRAKITRT